MIFQIVFVLRPDELAANLPDKRFETVLEPVLFHIPQHADLLRICLEIRPNIVVEGDHDLGVQRFRHAQDVCAGHLVSNAARVLAVGAEGDIDLMIVAVLGVIVGVVGIAAVIKVAARRFEQVVDRPQVHAVR